MPKLHTISRRRVLLTGAIASAAAVLGRNLGAAELRLDVNDPQALALGYVENAADVDLDRWPRKAGPGGDNQFCYNCVLYSAGADGWGGCTIFPGKLVKGAGWCNAWAPEA
ncbi:MAG: high-potential iron-sulfur protein [Pseudomonadales bacterium]